MGNAILRIPRDARVRTYHAWDTYDGVVSATSKRQPSCQSSFIYVSDTEEETLKEVTRRYFHKASGKHGSDGMGCLVFHTECIKEHVVKYSLHIILRHGGHLGFQMT